ncbi:MAG: hypothetical protein HYR55_05035 [Acidobacteria bacterium]|nr:hypothetical protein [Acidobacteriota bacterium]
MKESQIREQIAAIEGTLVSWFPYTLPNHYPNLRVSLLTVFLRLPEDILETFRERFHFVIEVLPSDTESVSVVSPPPIERVRFEGDYVPGHLLKQESARVYHYILFLESVALNKSSEYLMGTMIRYLADAYIRFVIRKPSSPGEGAETLAKEWGFTAEILAYLKEK